MSELDMWFPREDGVNALDVMKQARNLFFTSNAHFMEARKQGLLPKNFIVKNADLPQAERPRYNRVRYR